MKKRYLSIWFPYLMTDQMARRQPPLKGRAYALISKSNQRQIVVLPSHGARKMGLRKNIPLAEARILIPELEVFDYYPQEEQQTLNQLAQWFIRYSPHIALAPPDGLLLEIAGCQHLWGSEENYLNHIEQRMDKAGYFIKTAIANNELLAQAAARYGSKKIIHTIDEKATLATLPNKALQLDEATLTRLDKLGLYRLGNFINFSPSTLRRRFGNSINQQIAKITGNQACDFQSITEYQPYQERLNSLEPIRSAKGIELAIEQLLNRLCQQLHQENLGFRKAQLTCYRLDGQLQQISINTSLPSLNKIQLAKLFNLKINQIAPGLGIELFVMDALETASLLNQQESIWHSTSQQQLSEVTLLLDRIAIRAGKNAIRRYFPQEQHWPEKSIRAVHDLNDNGLSNKFTSKQRPCILLHQPEQIQVSAPIPDYPPMNFSYQGRLHRIIKADGPERIEAEWWKNEGLHRDYYAIENEQGERFWLFRLGHYNELKAARWFIHGFFA